MRRAAKVDRNQAEIVAALRAHGASVQPLHTVGQGCPDLLVGFDGQNFLLEIKDGQKIPSKQRLTPDQVEWHSAWGGAVAVAKDTADALAIVCGIAPECRQLLLN